MRNLRWTFPVLGSMLGLLAMLSFSGRSTAQAQQAAQQKGPQAMLVLDSSGSMWGQIDGVSKVVIAREALRETFRKWDPQIKLGVSVYGHRGQGNCNAITTLLKPQPVDEKIFSKAVATVRPNGMTPLTEAIRRAARTLNATQHPATVILLTDGLDNCNADPCAATAALKRKAPGLTAHVIAFRMKDEEADQLACIATNTGGKFLRAKDKPSLITAFDDIRNSLKPSTKAVASVPQQRSTPQPPSPPQHPAPPQQAAAPKPVQKLEDKQKHPRILKAKPQPAASPPLTAKTPKNIKQAKTDTALPQKRKPPKRRPAKRPNATNKSAAKKHPRLQAQQAQTVLQSFRAVLQPNGIPLDQDMIAGTRLVWRVFRQGDNPDHKTPIATATGNAPQIPLQAGNYRVVVTLFGTPFQKAFQIGALPPKTVEVPVRAGVALFRAVFGSEAQTAQNGLHWQIFANSGTEQQQQALFESHQATPSVLLPEGAYRVVLNHAGTTQTKQITIKAGEQEEHWLILPTGLVRLSAVLTKGQPAIRRGVRWDVFAATTTASNKAVAGGYQAEPHFSLLGGKYRVRAQVGFASATAELLVKPRQKTARVLDLNAGMVRLTATDAAGAPLRSGIRWEIYQQAIGSNGEQKRLGAIQSPRPIVTLPAGRYLIIVYSGPLQIERPLAIKAGETTNLTVALQ